MATRLSKDLVSALHAAGDDGIEVVDPDTHRVYQIVDRETHRRAMQALRERQDRNAIAEGIAQMEAEEGKPAERAFEEIQARLNLTRKS